MSPWKALHTHLGEKTVDNYVEDATENLVTHKDREVEVRHSEGTRVSLGVREVTRNGKAEHDHVHRERNSKEFATVKRRLDSSCDPSSQAHLPVCVVPQLDDDPLGGLLLLAASLHRGERIRLHWWRGEDGDVSLLLIREDILLVSRIANWLLLNGEDRDLLESALLGVVVCGGRAAYGRHGGDAGSGGGGGSDGRRTKRRAKVEEKRLVADAK